MTDVNDDRKLTEVFENEAKPYGYEVIEAEFRPFRDLKVKWVRSYKTISIEVADMMRGTDERYLGMLLGTVMARIAGDGTEPYPREFADYLDSEEAVAKIRPVYLELNGLGSTPELDASVARLRAAGFLDEGIEVVRNKYIGINHAACKHSAAGRVIVVNPRFLQGLGTLPLQEDAENALDYAVYAHALMVGRGFDPGDREDDTAELKEALSRFPHAARARYDIGRIGFRVGVLE